MHHETRLIELFKSKKGWYWRMKASNGRILAHSQTYKSKASAEKTAVSIEMYKYYYSDKSK